MKSKSVESRQSDSRTCSAVERAVLLKLIVVVLYTGEDDGGQSEV